MKTKYEFILLKEGFREAREKEKNIRFGLKRIVVNNEDIFESIYLPQDEFGIIDTSPLLSLGAERNYEAGRRYLLYSEMLMRLER